MRELKLEAGIIIVIAALLFIFFFQNCSSAFQAGVSSKGIASNSVDESKFIEAGAGGGGTGNGHGYDGKVGIYVRKLAKGESCSDGSDISSKIELTAAGQALLLRKDCADLSPVALDPQLTEIPGSQFLVFDLNAFAPISSYDPMFFAMYVCTNGSAVDPISVVIGMNMVGYTGQFTTAKFKSETFAVQMAFVGFDGAFIGTDSVGNKLTFVDRVYTSPTRSAVVSIDYGPSHTPAEADISSLNMTCYK